MHLMYGGNEILGSHVASVQRRATELIHNLHDKAVNVGNLSEETYQYDTNI